MAAKSKRKEMHIWIIMMVITLINLVTEVDMQEIKPTCSSNASCRVCQNQYLCSYCRWNGGVCCPKYCVSCSANNMCTSCQKGFIPFDFNNVGMKGMFCYNIDQKVDPNRNKHDPKKCNPGYYLHQSMNFCQPFQYINCEAYSDITKKCARCIAPYQLVRQKCVLNKDFTITGIPKNLLNLNSQQGTQTNSTNTNSKISQQDYFIFFFLLGGTLGCCFAFILVKIYFYIKRRLQTFQRKIKNKMTKKQKETQKLIQTAGRSQNFQSQQNQSQQKSYLTDQQKQFAQKGEGIFDKSIQLELNMLDISDIKNQDKKEWKEKNKKIKKQMITEGKP